MGSYVGWWTELIGHHLSEWTVVVVFFIWCFYFFHWVPQGCVPSPLWFVLTEASIWDCVFSNLQSIFSLNTMAGFFLWDLSVTSLSVRIRNISVFIARQTVLWRNTKAWYKDELWCSNSCVPGASPKHTAGSDDSSVCWPLTCDTNRINAGRQGQTE